MKRFLLLAAICSGALAQQPPLPSPAPPPSAAPQPSAAEKDELRRSLAEANSSEIEVLRVIEKYLADHPATQFRPDLEHRATLAAIAINDDALVVRYGQSSLERMPDDTQLLPAVTRSLLAIGSRQAVELALQYARHTEDLVLKMQIDGNPGNVNPIEWRNQTDLLLNRALIDDARATGILGRPEEALATAQRAFDTYPDAAAARELAFWFDRLGKSWDAVRALADAFSIPDAHATDAERAQDRARLGELYRQAKGSEDGLGDLCLAAYDRTAALLEARDLRLHRGEPNAGRTNPMEFTLSAMDGPSFAMASLKGKVVVMDLWATWCVPCREQHPLYEQVKTRFRDNSSVVFLSIDADADRTPVKAFVSQQKWQGPVYFEDGLARVFSVDGLPATIVLDRNGRLFTHLNGYVDKTRFVDLLTERIRGALAVPVK
jgi:thiol-disulfide isomerase/thioredoxin